MTSIFNPISVSRLRFENGVKKLTTSSKVLHRLKNDDAKNNIMSIFGQNFWHRENDLRTDDAKTSHHVNPKTMQKLTSCQKSYCKFS